MSGKYIPPNPSLLQKCSVNEASLYVKWRHLCMYMYLYNILAACTFIFYM